MNTLFLRALFAFLALPGIVAFLIPWRMAVPGRVVHPWGFLPFALGVVLLLWCVREFYTAGKGTLAPWSPPRHLVVSGPYRFSRNPMYVGVLLILAGWAVAFASRAVALYALAVFAAFQARIVWGEEPWLTRTHGDAWTAYEATVRRWGGVRRRPPARSRTIES